MRYPSSKIGGVYGRETAPLNPLTYVRTETHTQMNAMHGTVNDLSQKKGRESYVALGNI